MQSIDELKFSDDSYEVEMVRKSSKDFTNSQDSASDDNSMSLFDPNFAFKSNYSPSFNSSIDPSIEPKFGIALFDFRSVKI